MDRGLEPASGVTCSETVWRRSGVSRRGEAEAPWTSRSACRIPKRWSTTAVHGRAWRTATLRSLRCGRAKAL